jgi:cytosine deaminase
MTEPRRRPGGPANLLVHDAAREVDLLARHEPPRAVIRAGELVAGGAGPG